MTGTAALPPPVAAPAEDPGDEDRLRRLRLAAAAGGDAPIDPNRIDQRGAPARVRAAVGNARTPEDRLATLKSYYPDAEPYGDDDNFVFTDPQTKRKTIYNPKGFQFADLPSIGPEIAETIGGAGGAAVAAAGAPVTGGGSLLTVPASAGAGAALGRELYDMATKAILGTKDTRGVGTRLTDTGVTAGVNAIGTRVGDLVSRAGKALVSAIPGRRVPTGSQAVTEFQNQGVTPSAGATTGNRTMQTLEHGLHNLPGSASVMQRQAQQQIDEVARAADDLAQQFGQRATAQETGATMRTGARQAGERFAQRREQLDDAIEAAIGSDTVVPTPHVRQLVGELEQELAEAPASRTRVLKGALDRARALLEDVAPTRDDHGRVVQGAGIGFRTLRRIRTDVGKDLERPDVSGYSPAAEASMRRLYGAIAEDVQAAAQNAGPDALRALRTHDRYVRFNRNINLPLLQEIADKGTDEAAFRYAMSGTKDGGTNLARLRRSLTPEQWDVVASTAFSRLGRAVPSAQGAADLGQEATDFSVNSFLKNWTNMAPEARRALFGGTRYQQLTPNLNELTRVVDRLKDADKLANKSGTARSVLVGGLGLGVGQMMAGEHQSGAATIAGTVVAPRLAAQLITSPRFVRWLTDSVVQTANRPEQLGPRLGRLVAVAKAEPEIREAIYGYLDAMRAAPQQREP